ncbi:LLM class F420-dependent oxidoreductase [Myxococcota bacterium]|nr:LLM class F420-dependent oxidoreductase [Myxococcota bacterium]
MDIGIMIFPTDKSIQPIELAKEVEARGFESLWFPEHSHIPTSRATPWGGFKGMPDLPEEYWRAHDQFVALGACAAVTEKILLGTGITLVAQRDPIWLAKEVATLDYISKGRVLLGVGYGWCREEMANHKLNFKERRSILRENILLMKELWTKEEASFSGDHIQFDESWAWPKPVQKPHPPILMGSAGDSRAMAHTAEFCDGWMPIGGAHDIKGGLEKLSSACADVGRDPKPLSLGVFGAKAKPDALESLAELGVTRAVLPLPQIGRDKALKKLDEYGDLLPS